MIATRKIGAKATGDFLTLVRNGARVQTRLPMKRLKLLAAMAIALGAVGRSSAAAEAVPVAAEAVPFVVALEFAAGQGDPRAMTELALKYEHAEGVPKDLHKANALYCNAAKQGYAEAQFRLGWVYANGRGVQRDDAVAAELFAMAAQLGHEHATKLLKYIPKRSDARLPSCLLPDPSVTLAPELSPPGTSEATVENRSEIEQLVHRFAPQYAVDPELALAVVSVESAFNPMAVSPRNAQGLMQLIPETAERFGVKRVFDPSENIKGGLAYLRWLLAFFQGDVPLVVAAYNAGERAVEKYRGIPPYPETRDYVRKITRLYKNAKHPYQPEVVEPSPIMVRIKRAQG